MPISTAARRLASDLRELMAYPVHGVEAMPLEDNILQWRVNMVTAKGPLQDAPIHLHMTFPPTYPEAPPDVQLISDINAAFKIGDRLCIDMLRFSGFHGDVETEPYTGWSAAYSVSSILMQLYGLLLADRTAMHQRPGFVARCRESLQQCACGFHHLPDCKAANTPTAPPSQRGPGPSGVPPPAPAAAADPLGRGREAAASLPSTLGSLELLDDHVVRLLLSKLPAQDLHRCSGAGNARLARLSCDVLQRSELLCFFTHRPYTEAVLGYGVKVQRRGGRRQGAYGGGPGSGAYGRGPGSGAAAIHSLSSKTDYVSLEAFELGVRHSAWNMAFDAFLPLYLNPEHGSRALAALPSCIARLLGSPSSAPGKYPSQLLAVMSLLMNSLVVEMVSGTSASVAVSRHMSDAALAGFCHLHHLLLAVALQPDGDALRQQAARDVAAFIDNPAARHKQYSPDLGRLLVAYLLVPEEEAPWSEFAPAFIRELLARQVRWVMDKAAPGYAQPQQERHTVCADSQCEFERLSQHFSGSVIGIRNVMLQTWFANALARPRTSGGARDELRAIKVAYDELSGRPAPRVFAAFNAHARGVMRCGSWADFLSGLRLGLLLAAGSGCSSSPRGLFVAVLSQAVLDSFDAGYHRGPSPYAGVGRVLCEQHKLRRQQEKQQLLPLPAEAAGSPAGAGSASECSEGAERAESSWLLVAKRASQAAAIRQRVGQGSAPRRVAEERPLCFVSWELRPIGVVSDVWM